MEYVSLGRTGLKVSRICLGCMTYGRPPAPGEPAAGRHAWALNEDQSQPFLKQALDLGINFFDTANVYSSGASEEVLGRFLKKNVRRESVVVATKVWGPMRDEPNGRGLSRKEILFELDESLQRLQMDYVDLYQIHRWDEETPIEETLEALHDVVKAGQGAVHRGLVDALVAVREGAVPGGTARVDAVRVDAEPLQPALPGRGAGDDSAVRGGGDRGHSVEPTGARAAGQALAERDDEAVGDGSVRQHDVSKTEEADQKVVEALTELAKKRGVPQAQIALAWMLGKLGITAPIVGATKANHLEDAVAALG